MTLVLAAVNAHAQGPRLVLPMTVRWRICGVLRREGTHLLLLVRLLCVRLQMLLVLLPGMKCEAGA